MESNDLLAPASLCTALDNDLIEQIVAADQNGEREVTVRVLLVDSEDNWPHALYIGPRIACSLYKHGVTGRRMEVTIEPSFEVNQRFHVLEDIQP